MVSTVFLTIISLLEEKNEQHVLIKGHILKKVRLFKMSSEILTFKLNYKSTTRKFKEFFK